MSKRDNRVVTNFGPTLTKQSFAADCNVNNVVAKYASLGVLNHLNPEKPRYIDCVSVPDYQASLDIIQRATDQFVALPAKIRAHFANDPAEFLQFCSDPANAQALVKMGLAVVPGQPENTPEQVSQGAEPST